MPTNLWKPGQSGNPNGRPKKGLAAATLLTEIGDEIWRGAPGEHTNREFMFRRLYNHANTGEMTHPTTIRAIEIILEREYGKALETINFDRTNEDPPSAQELRVLLRLREEQEKDEQANSTKGDLPAESL
jgi:hypothetical protein